MTKTQIDRLGERLRTDPVEESDLRLLDEYRRSFGTAYESVVETVKRHMSLQVTGRPAKSTISIVDKLKRESIRLSQMQDIAGCRVIVSDMIEQRRLADVLLAAFEKASLVDRRERPSYGYRAVHIVALVEGKPIEVQIRTTLQHLWAELSEKISDLVDASIKYGGGPDRVREMLADTSDLIAKEEALESKLAGDESWLEVQRGRAAELRTQAKSTISRLAGVSLTPKHVAAKQQLEENDRNLEAIEMQIVAKRETIRLARDKLASAAERTRAMLRELIAGLPERNGSPNVIPD
jgi:ppGpp synthetase/RelA/SpoT-type nucleotidyltranferase